MIDIVFAAAMAVDTNGAEMTGADPAAASVKPVSRRNRRRVTRPDPLFLILRSSSLVWFSV
ncbi:MAG: hypothetical protein P8Z80_18030 [Pseudolabrys sp.]